MNMFDFIIVVSTLSTATMGATVKPSSIPMMARIARFTLIAYHKTGLVNVLKTEKFNLGVTMAVVPLQKRYFLIFPLMLMLVILIL